MRNPHEECVTQKGLLKHSAQHRHTRHHPRLSTAVLPSARSLSLML
jgi:hypothetical protein